MRATFLTAASAVLLLPACLGLRGRAYAGAMAASIEGNVALDSSSGTLDLGANRVDVQDELGLDGTEESPALRAELGLPGVAFTVSGFDYSQTGSGTLAGNHRYGDILPGSQVDSHLKVTNVKAAMHFDLVHVGVFRLSPGLAVDFIDFDLQVAAPGTGASERVDTEVFVPMLFAQSEVNLGIVAATLDLGYMQASLADADGQYIDVEALVRISPLPFFEIFAGYRLIDVDSEGTADERRSEADLRLQGWMVGGGVTF